MNTDFNEFLERLSRYNKRHLVYIGVKLLWSSFYKFCNFIDTDDDIFISSYGPNIITLALEYSNNNDHNKISITENKFLRLCKIYRNIKDTIQDPAALKNEKDEIIKVLNTLDNNDKIDSEFITEENIYKICEYNWLVRSYIIPNHMPISGINTILTMLEVFEILDEDTNSEARKILNDSGLNMTPESFLRCGCILFYTAQKNKGYISLENTVTDESFKKKYPGTNKGTAIETALKLSLNNNGKEFFKNLYKIPPIYRRNFKNLLINFPMLNLNQSTNVEFLIPSPIHYITYFFYKIIYYCSTTNKMRTAVGNAFEKYVGNALKEIFYPYNVENIYLKDLKHADYLIELDICDLIIETKVSLTDPKEKFILGPDNIKKIFKVLNEGCEQCANSIKFYKPTNKPRIAIILTAEYIYGQQLPFLKLAKNGLFKNKGISHIGILSWNIFEHIAQHVNIKDMVNAMLSQWNVEDNNDERDLIALSGLTYNSKPKNFKYIKDIENKLLKKNT